MMAYERYQAGLAPDDLKVRDCGSSDDHVDGEGAAPSGPAASGSNAASDQADEGVSSASANGSDEGGNSAGIASSGERSVKKPNTAATVASVTAQVEGQRATSDRNPVEPEALPQSGNGEILARKDTSVSEVGEAVAGVGVVEADNSGSRVKSGGDESRGGAGSIRSVEVGCDRPRVQDEGDTLAWRKDEGQEEKKRDSVEVRGKKRAIDEASV